MQLLTGDVFASKFTNAHLPKFSRFEDNINGLGISIHEVNSTQINLESLIFKGNRFTAVIHYKGQDHFGLDINDISNVNFHYLQIFRIWFVLQRYKKLVYRPFFTNFEAKVTIAGENNV